MSRHVAGESTGLTELGELGELGESNVDSMTIQVFRMGSAP